MDFFKVARERRSVRSFEGRPVPRRSIESCLNAARLAPSGTNAQPWRFLVIRDPEKRRLLAEAGFNQPCLKEAPVITVLLGDRGVYKKRLRRAKELSDIGALNQDTLSTLEANYAKRDSKELNDQKITANCMLAGEHYILAASALELGSCWVMLFDGEKATEALGIDAKNNFIVALLPTGYAKGDEIPPRPRYALSQVAWEEVPDRPWIEELEDWDMEALVNE